MIVKHCLKMSKDEMFGLIQVTRDCLAEEYQKAHMGSKKLEMVDARKRDGHGRKNSERRKDFGKRKWRYREY